MSFKRHQFYCFVKCGGQTGPLITPSLAQISHINPARSYPSHALCVDQPHSPQYIQLSQFLLLEHKSEQDRQLRPSVTVFLLCLF